ncbi:MAG: hypothetical protein ACYCPR_12460, partial [Thermoplasmataceae archaeon]
ETEHVGRGTPEVTPVEIGSIPERANPVVETGSPRSSDVGGCHNMRFGGGNGLFLFYAITCAFGHLNSVKS